MKYQTKTKEIMPEKRDDHDLLIRISVLVEEIGKKLDGYNDRFVSIESRITRLENWKWYIVGGAAAAMTAFQVGYRFFVK